MKSLLLAVLASSLFQPSFQASDERTYIVNPTVDLSAIRSIVCITPDGLYEGSGFLIGNKIMATANHVAVLSTEGECYDGMSHTPLSMYKNDPRHDFALMTGPKLPTNIPYIKYDCSRFIKGQTYVSYGLTDYGQATIIFRTNNIVDTGEVVKTPDLVEGFQDSNGMEVFNGPIAPGVSGGPVMDINGVAHGVNNAGDDTSTAIFNLGDIPLLCPPAKSTSSA